MANPVSTYQSEMHRNFGFFATWLPGDPIKIGDIGTLMGGRFRRVSSLDEVEVPFAESEPGPVQNVQYTSASGAKVNTTAAADATGLAKAEVAIDFSAEGAFIFHASGMRARQLKGLSMIEAGVLKAYESGKWQKDWLIVDAVQEASCATIVVSHGRSASLVLAAKIAGAVPTLSLADPKIGFDVSATSGELLHIVGGRQLKPLYSCVRIQHRFFGKPSLAPVLGSAEQASRFEHAGLDELLNT
jgi:hypothetical protein